MNKLWLTVLIALLIAVCLAQRGGGGGGGGGRGGRGGSSTRTSCSKICGSDQACLQKCRAGANSGPISGGVIAIVVCGIVGPIITVVGGVCLWHHCSKNKKCPCHKFLQLKKKYNQMDTQIMTNEQFLSQRNKIITMLNNSKSQQNYFFFQNDIQQVVVVSSVQIVKERPFISQLKISGSDPVGAWDAVAFILCRDGGIFMWLYKQYIERLQARQTGDWDHLVHVSSIFLNGEELKGNWFFLGFEENNKYSGSWELHHWLSSEVEIESAENFQTQRNL